MQQEQLKQAAVIRRPLLVRIESDAHACFGDSGTTCQGWADVRLLRRAENMAPREGSSDWLSIRLGGYELLIDAEEVER
jgi:hypothetical protein